MEPEIEVEVVSLAEVPDEIDELPTNDLDTDEVPLILVVDDEEILADTRAAILMRSGLAVKTAYNASAALEIAMHQPPALLLSDVKMPGASGIELAIAMVDLVPPCKILLVSGHAVAADLAEAQEAGYDFALLPKPMHPAQLLEHVFHCLGRQFDSPPESLLPEFNPAWLGTQIV